MIKAQEISQIKDVQFVFESITFLKDDKLYVDNMEIFKCSKTVERIVFWDGNLLLLNDLNEVEYVLDSHYNLIPNQNFHEVRIRKSIDETLYFYKKTNPRTYGFLEKEREFQTTLPYSNLFISRRLIFDESYLSVDRIDDNYGIVWQHDLSHLGVLEGNTDEKKDGFLKFLGVAHHNLWILAESGKIIAINIETGVLTKTFEWVDEYVDGERYRPNPTEAFIYDEDNNIYSLGNYFLKINTKTLEIELKKIMFDAVHNEDKIKLRSSSVQGQNISFIASTYGTSWQKIIGLFSIKEQKVIWTYELFGKEENKFIPVFNTPQLSGDKLYILDNEKTLHIFEKDKQV